MEVAKVRSQFATFFSVPFCLFSTRGREGVVEKVWREIVIIKTKRDSKLTIPPRKNTKTSIFYTFLRVAGEGCNPKVDVGEEF